MKDSLIWYAKINEKIHISKSILIQTQKTTIFSSSTSATTDCTRSKLSQQALSRPLECLLRSENNLFWPR